MEDPGTERLSRLIDGDLDREETAEVTAALETNRGSRRELEGLNRVRSSLMSLAAREHPPERLDALVDPLLRGRPEPTAFARPWVRRLAAAAMVFLAVSVIIGVQRQQPAPAIHNWQERAREGAAAEPNERFSLAPLPTSAVPADERPLGAADRLVAAPEPEIDKVLAPAPVLEVMGPLSSATTGETGGASRKDPAVDPSPRPESPADDEGRTGEKRAATAGGQRGPAAVEPPRSQTGPSARLSDAEVLATPPGGAQLFVFMEAETAWRSFDPGGQCEAGRYALRIRIEDGVVREVWPVANPPAPTRQVRASQLILGLEIDDVADGEYSAEVVVEPRNPRDR